MVAATLLVALGALLFFSLNPPPERTQTNTTGVSCSSFRTNFVVIANERGYNDSIDHGVPQSYWPVLCVHEGDAVTIRVLNTGSEPHGFAIDHYYPVGASLAEGKNITVTFIADKTGSFLMYCTILCAVHPWMLSGLVVVR